LVSLVGYWLDLTRHFPTSPLRLLQVVSSMFGLLRQLAGDQSYLDSIFDSGFDSQVNLSSLSLVIPQC
jgi:hypothetical protein